MRTQPLLAVLCILFFSACESRSFAVLKAETDIASTARLPAPQIFAPGVISGAASDGSPTFSPDGNTLFFTRSAARWSVILESRRVHGTWTGPKIASFSGTWSDSSPALAPDGSYLVFVSVRPMKADPLGDKEQNNERGKQASHIWRSDRTADGWSTPVELPDAVNFCRNIFRPSLARDGSVYFTAAGQGKELRLFRAQFANGQYKRAEALPFSDGSVKDVDPEIAPDQTFLIFTRMEADAPHEKLFLVYNRSGAWGKVQPLRYIGDDANGSSEDNDARLGSDLKTLYFSSDRSVEVHFPRSREAAESDTKRLQDWDNGNANIWSMSIESILPDGKG